MSIKNKRAHGVTRFFITLFIFLAVIAIAMILGVIYYKKENAKILLFTEDKEYVLTLNRYLQEDEIRYGKQPTMHDALSYLNLKGYNVLEHEFNNGEIVWDSLNNRLGLIDGTKIVYQDGRRNLSIENANLFKAYSSYAEAKQDDAGYSIYLLNTNETEIANLKRGLDVGSNENITLISYIGDTIPKDTLIRTNGGQLTINSPKDTVNHFGTIDYLNIVAVNTRSYHEFGYVPQAQISQGRIVIEQSNVKLNNSTKKSAIDNLFIVGNDDGKTFSEVIVEAKGDAKIPNLDRTDVDIVGSVLVVEVKTDETDDFIYLTKSGIIEQVVVTTEKGVIDLESGKAKTGNSQALSETQSKAADEIANLAKRGANGNPLKADGVTEMTDEEVKVIESVNDIAIETTKTTLEDLEKSKGENALFDGGAGSKVNPYLISNETQFLNIKETFDENKSSAYFKLTNNIDLSNLDARKKIQVYGKDTWFGEVTSAQSINIDLNNHSINNLDCYLFGVLINGSIVNGSIGYSGKDNALVYYPWDAQESATLTFKNLVLNGEASVEGNQHFGPIIGQAAMGSAPIYLTLDNIVSNLTVLNLNNTNGYAAGLSGQITGSNRHIKITNCTVNGFIQGLHAAGFLGCQTNCETFTNNTLNAKVIGGMDAHKVGIAISDSSQLVTNGLIMGEDASVSVATKITNLFDESLEIGDEIVVNHTNNNVKYYAVSVEFWYNYETLGYNKSIYSGLIEVQDEQSSYNSGIYKNYFEETNTDNSAQGESVNCYIDWGKIWRDNDTYYLYNTENYHLSTKNRYTITVFGYDENNVLVTYQTQTYEATK